jgi:hypothetical protein
VRPFTDTGGHIFPEIYSDQGYTGGNLIASGVNASGGKFAADAK